MQNTVADNVRKQKDEAVGPALSHSQPSASLPPSLPPTLPPWLPPSLAPSLPPSLPPYPPSLPMYFLPLSFVPFPVFPEFLVFSNIFCTFLYFLFSSFPLFLFSSFPLSSSFLLFPPLSSSFPSLLVSHRKPWSIHIEETDSA